MKPLHRITVASALLLSAATAQAHGKLLLSNPGNGATLAHAPTELRLRFDEPVEAAFTKVSSSGPQDRSVATGPTMVDKADPKVVVLSVPVLSSGACRAEWTMVGPDGHKVQGTVAFTVK